MLFDVHVDDDSHHIAKPRLLALLVPAQRLNHIRAFSFALTPLLCGIRAHKNAPATERWSDNTTVSP